MQEKLSQEFFYKFLEAIFKTQKRKRYELPHRIFSYSQIKEKARKEEKIENTSRKTEEKSGENPKREKNEIRINEKIDSLLENPDIKIIEYRDGKIYTKKDSDFQQELELGKDEAEGILKKFSSITKIPFSDFFRADFRNLRIIAIKLPNGEIRFMIRKKFKN